MRMFDWPPVWTLSMILLVVFADRWFPAVSVDLSSLKLTAIGLVLYGLTITVLAARELHRLRTTIIPRQNPNALVTGGIFRFTRNPIYLADLCFLTATVFWTGFLPGIIVVFILKRILTIRFIEGEEAALSAAFGDEFDQWANLTRRWM